MEMRPRILKKYVTDDGNCPYDKWFDGIKDRRTQAIIATRLNRLIQGNFGHCRFLGEGLVELKIDYGPGYRIYFSEDGKVLLVLFCGGNKSTQDSDIKKARKMLKQHRTGEE